MSNTHCRVIYFAAAVKTEYSSYVRRYQKSLFCSGHRIDRLGLKEVFAPSEGWPSHGEDLGRRASLKSSCHGPYPGLVLSRP